MCIYFAAVYTKYKRVRHNLVTKQQQTKYYIYGIYIYNIYIIYSSFHIYMVKVLVAHHVPLFATPGTVCSLPGSSVHGILQARILKWVAIPFSRGTSWPRDWTQVSCIAGRFFYRLNQGKLWYFSLQSLIYTPNSLRLCHRCI